AAKSVTIALSGLGPWVYDGSAHPATVSVGGEVAGFAATVTVTYAGSTIAPSAVGSYAVVAALDAAVTDYAATPASGVLVIGAQNATVTLGDLGAVYDGTAHAASATTQPSGLAVSLSYDGSGTAPTNAGSYAVVATITTPGYSGAASGTLVITKASATVTIGDTTQAWDGTPRAVSVVTVPAGLTVDVSYDGSASAPSAVGSYAVLASVNETNYSGSAAATLIITSGAASTLAANGATTFTGTAGQALAAPLPSVKVTDAGGNPVAGVAITFSAGAGSGTLSGASPTTDQNGIATLGGWILDTMPGTNTVTASAVGVTGTVTFTAEGAAVAGALSATITDGRVATQVGRLLTYTITVGNGGSAAINAVTVTDTLPGELDAATASWQCIAINGASCTASGSGNLADSVNLPAGSSVVYLLNARVIDDLDGMIDNSVTVSGGGDSLVRTDSTEIVIFRDGFELGGDGAQWSRSDELANAGALSEDKAVTLALDAAALAPLQRVVLAQAADGAFSVEAIRIDARVYLRLVVADVASAWSVAGDDHIALVLVGRHLSLVGAESELSLDLPQGGTFMLERLTRH
ncbi:MBG domain-containing protein, partial [Dokdonella sp.]|uniref:MBG domain-containing protein n=1 Tax=Dokdonella sp. TaxID=2291710 RepID=UPI0027B9D143